MCDALLFHNWWVRRDKVGFIIAKLGFGSCDPHGSASRRCTNCCNHGSRSGRESPSWAASPQHPMQEAWFKDVEGRNCNKNKGVWDSVGEYWLDKTPEITVNESRSIFLSKVSRWCKNFCPNKCQGQGLSRYAWCTACSLSYERRRLQAARTELSVKGGDVHMKLWRLAGIPLSHQCMSVKARLLLVVQVDSAGRTSVSYLLFWRAPEPPDSAALKPNPLIYYHELPRAA